MVTLGEGRVLGHPRHGVCTNASRGLSSVAEFLVLTRGFGVKFYGLAPFLVPSSSTIPATITTA